MMCLHRECLYNNDEEIPEDSTVTKKLQLLQLHLGAEHAAPPSEQPVATARTE